MSIQAVAAVLDADIPDVRMKMLLVCLANAHNAATGACFPSIGRLVRESGMPRSTVKKWLQLLEDAGHIKKGVAFDPETGRQIANLYVLAMLGEGSHGDLTEGPHGGRGRGHSVTGRSGHVVTGGRGHTVAGGGATLVTPSKDTGRNTKKERAGASASAGATTKVSRVTEPKLFAECERLRGKSATVNRDGAWFFPAELVDRARGNLEQAGEGSDAA